MNLVEDGVLILARKTVDPFVVLLLELGIHESDYLPNHLLHLPDPDLA